MAPPSSILDAGEGKEGVARPQQASGASRCTRSAVVRARIVVAAPASKALLTGDDDHQEAVALEPLLPGAKRRPLPTASLLVASANAMKSPTDDPAETTHRAPVLSSSSSVEPPSARAQKRLPLAPQTHAEASSPHDFRTPSHQVSTANDDGRVSPAKLLANETLVSKPIPFRNVPTNFFLLE
ncbi:hypothetical protein ZWY2020_040430 [Hordeum vulgare]|nr:hypothetical protein ZWY2020_040430 [Hordeum vulgare]